MGKRQRPGNRPSTVRSRAGSPREVQTGDLAEASLVVGLAMEHAEVAARPEKEEQSESFHT